MSQTCSVVSCKRSSCALCHCCQQNICLPHLKEHQDALLAQLNPLVDEINVLSDRLKEFNIENIIGDARSQLEEWCVDCHQQIDYFFKQKYEELDRHITQKLDKHKEEMNRIQSKVAELIREQDASREIIDSLTSTTRHLEDEITKLETTHFKTTTRFLTIEDSWISFQESTRHIVDLTALSPIYKKLACSVGSSVSLASNNRFLLMHQNQNLSLVDQTLTVVKHARWNHGYIHDMCWSSILNRFILVEQQDIFLFDQNTMSIEKMISSPTIKWLCGTSSNKSVFLSTYALGSSILEYSLSPPIQLVKQWNSPDTCGINEAINHMRYNNETLMLLIKNTPEKTLCIELRSSTTLARLWSFPLNIDNVQKRVFRSCLVNKNEWLITDHETRRLVHVTNDGKMKGTCAFDSVPQYPVMFGPEMLVIFAGNGVNFHKL